LKLPLRQVLADSYVSDIAIAALLLRALEQGIRVLWTPLEHLAVFLFTAVAILDVPYFSHTFDAADRFLLTGIFINLISALTAFASAWLLSRWVYGAGPIRSLSICCSRLRRSSHV
jgi:hypothetical protein